MADKKRCAAIVLAAGSGKRMGGRVKKQFMELMGHPVIYYPLKVFEESFVDDIILVTSPGDEEYCKKEIVEGYGFKKVAAVVTGGRQRYNSVYEGIRTAAGLGAGYVFIHDGARAFVSREILDRCLEGVVQYGACTAGVPVKDTVKEASADGFVERTLNRELLWSIQTPQVFETGLIRDCYEKLLKSEEELISRGVAITDDNMAVEYFSDVPVKLIMGSYDNIKLTTPEDLIIGERILMKRSGKNV